jgi:RNA recognition motif-containing protein
MAAVQSRVGMAARPPSVDRPYREVTMNLFVDGLPAWFSSQDLADLFNNFGTVFKAEVVKNKEGNSLQFGFVAMGTSREAYRAMASLNGSTVRDHLLLVMPAENQWSPGRARYSTHDKPSSFA